MKVKGHKSGLSRAKILIDRGEGRGPLELTLTALALGSTQEFDKKIPGPVPRDIKPLMQHGQVIRNADGSPVMLTDSNTPAFKEAEQLANRRQSTLMVHRALANDTNVSFDAAEKDFKTAGEYADAIFQELAEFGLAIGDFGRLVSETLNVSHLSSKKLDEAREAFLPVEREEDSQI